MLARADRTMRVWQSDVSGPITIGSDIHKREMCRMFRDTFNPYRPSVLAWPNLDAATRDKIVSLPIWDIAVQTEGKARLRMAAFACMQSDLDLRHAFALNAWEESRHKDVLTRLVETYGVALEPESPYVYPGRATWAYLVTGYSECIDSFFAFGLFDVARRSGLFPAELIETFEPVIQEECRHILLFANWIAWYRAKLSWLARLRFELEVAGVWIFLVWERIGIARAIDGNGPSRAHRQDNNFTVSGAQSVSNGGIALHELMTICIAENDRRFAGYDARLARPVTMPKIVRFALRFMRPRAR
ncbi:ferritin-like domain-containing protein [Pararobbsia silviterrae]|uniref:Ferritin-like domain-containing protein n=2 Tax=Pararobbsia silviterrae TaxID=1792498 RepID=A0A494XYT4_9BURK|nr:ferritin-like domain-containing protein [Pararobbsia silviterrae]